MTDSGNHAYNDVQQGSVFSEVQRKELQAHFELPKEAIDQLADVINREKTLLEHYAPISLKQRNQVLSSLQTNVSRVVDCLESLDSRHTDFKFHIRQRKVLAEIELLKAEISRLLTSKNVTATRKASNRYSELVSGTATILNEYNPGLIRKRGQDLTRFFEIILESVGQDKKSTRLLIEDNWQAVIEPIIRGYGDHADEEGYDFDSLDEEMIDEDAEDRDP